MKLNISSDLFIKEMQDLYNIEAQLVEALPQITEAAASSLELRNAFEDHLGQTKKYIDCIEEVFSYFDSLPKGRRYVGMERFMLGENQFLSQHFQENILDSA